MNITKVLVPLVIYLIIAVGMLAVFKWVGLESTKTWALIWASYIGGKALSLVVWRDGFIKAGKMDEDTDTSIKITLAVGIAPFIFLGWWECLAYGIVTLSFEMLSTNIIKEYKRSTSKW